VADPLLVRAARREHVERTPVWFMRQAGRSLPEYREIRKRHSLFDVCRRPELCAEVTLQPVSRHRVDAAVMFADIMLPVIGMGVDVELVDGIGPVVAEPIASLADVERLRVPDPEEAVPFVLEAVRLVRDDLAEHRAVVGFAGGPFTVAGYLIEGKPTRDFVKTPRRPRGAHDPFRDGDDAPSARDEGRRGRRHRPRLAGADRPLLGVARLGPRRAGKPRPGRPVGPMGARRGLDGPDPRRRRRPSRAHLQPRPRRPA
jgi:hypothetical protein